jgi:hypothetical protein
MVGTMSTTSGIRRDSETGRDVSMIGTRRETYGTRRDEGLYGSPKQDKAKNDEASLGRRRGATIGTREGHEGGRAGNEFELRGNWGRGLLFFCLLQGNYLYKFLRDYETEGTKGNVWNGERELSNRKREGSHVW